MSGSSIPQSVKTSLEAAALAVSDLNTVITSLNTARSVVITIANNTSMTLNLLNTSHTHGGFSIGPPGIISKQTTVVFGSQSKANSIATGTEGSVTYQVDGATTFTVRWDNPFIGSNESDQSLDGSHRNAYRGVSSTGAGDQKAAMRYDIFEIEMNGHRVVGAILDKWAETGWSSGALGLPLTDEADTQDGRGRFNNFQVGSILFRPEIGAQEVHGGIAHRWNELGRERFGYPVTDEITTSDGGGRFSHFRTFFPDGRTADSSIFWTPATGAHEIFGAIRDKWASMNWEKSSLGYPVDGEKDTEGGRIQHFQNGTILFTRSGDIIVKP